MTKDELTHKLNSIVKAVKEAAGAHIHFVLTIKMEGGEISIINYAPDNKLIDQLKVVLNNSEIIEPKDDQGLNWKAATSDNLPTEPVFAYSTKSDKAIIGILSWNGRFITCKNENETLTHITRYAKVPIL